MDYPTLFFSLSYEAAQRNGKLELGQVLKPRKKKIVTLINLHTSNPRTQKITEPNKVIISSLFMLFSLGTNFSPKTSPISPLYMIDKSP